MRPDTDSTISLRSPSVSDVQVFHAASEPKTLRVVSKAGHNDLFEQGAWTQVRDFIASLTPEPVVVLPVARAGQPVEAVAAANADK